MEEDHYTALHQTYSQAIAKFKVNLKEEGIILLQSVLENQIINDEQMHDLRYSALISLGQALTDVAPLQALNCFEGALCLIDSHLQGSLSGSNKDQEFSLIIKMIQLTQHLNMLQRQIQLLQKAVKKSPLKWKKQLLQKLKELLVNNNRHDKLIELQTEEEQNDIRIEYGNELADEHEKKQEEGNHLRSIKIKLTLLENSQAYTVWEKILAFAYILLKFHQKRNLTSKPLFHKWVNTEEWQCLRMNFDLFRTEIQITFNEQGQQNLMDKLVDLQDKAVKIGNMLLSAAGHLLKQRHHNYVAELKKYEFHVSYNRLEDYFREIMNYRGFNQNNLMYLSMLNPTAFEGLFAKVIERNNWKENRQKQPQEGIFTTKRISQSPFVEKQLTDTQKNMSLNEQLKQMLRIDISAFSSEDTISFQNVLVMVERIAGVLVTQATEVPSQQAIISHFEIRLMLLKTMSLLIKNKETALQEITESNVYDENGEASKTAPEYIRRKAVLLELVNIRISQLAFKKPKNLEFSQHQTQKIAQLISYAKKRIIKQDESWEKLGTLELAELAEYVYFATQILRFYCITNQQKLINQTKIKLGSYHNTLQQVLKDEGKNDSIEVDNLQQTIKIFKKRMISQQLRKQESQKERSLMRDRIKRSPEYLQLAPIKRLFGKQQDQSSINEEKYLQNAINLFEGFFNRLQNQKKLIIISEVSIWAQALSIKQIISHIYNRLSQKKNNNQESLPLNIYSQLLMNVLKIYLLDAFQENDTTLRVIFYLHSIILKQIERQKGFVQKCLIMCFRLVKYKEFSGSALSKIRKKLYSNLVSQHIEALFEPQYYREQTNKKQLLSILSQIYLWPQFDPKRAQQSVGFFNFVYHAKQTQIIQGRLVLQPDLVRITKICYKIYEQKYQQIFTFCQIFFAKMKLFGTVMHGEGNSAIENQLKAILRGEERICECCQNLKAKMPLFYRTLKVIAGYHLQKPYLLDQDQPGFTFKFSMLDELYLLQLILIDPKESINWQNLLKANYFKVNKYYDSLVHKPLQEVKPKVQFLRKLVSIALQIFPPYHNIKSTCDYYQEILGVMKIRERQYRMVMKDVEGAGMNTCKESKESIKRYKEGLKRILSEAMVDPKNDVRIRTLRVIEFKLKLAWISIQKEYKQDDKKQTVIIQLQEYENIEDKVFKPSKLKEQILDIVADIKGIVFDLKRDQRPDEVLPLEEDLIVEMYAFLFNTMYWKLEKIVNRLCEVIRVSSKTDQCRKLKEMQQKFNELEYIATIFWKGDFLSNNHKYKVREEREQDRKREEKIKRDEYQMMFYNIFAPKMEPQKLKPPEPINVLLDAKYGRPKGRKDIIRIQQETNTNQYTEIQDNMSMNSRVDDNRSTWGSGNRKSKHFNPSNHINVGKYFYQRLKQYMIDNEAAASRFNAIESVIGSFSFYNLLYSLTKIMQELLRVFTNIIQGKDARTKNRRALAIAMWTASQIVLFYSGNWEKANDIVKEAYDLESDQVVKTHVGNSGPQHEIFPITQLYHRSIVEQMTKKFYFQHLFRIFQKACEIDKIILLLTKLLKLSKGHADNTVPSDLKVGAKLTIGQSESIEDIVSTENIKFYFFMFEVGTTYFVDALKKISKDEQLPKRYEKYLVMAEEEIQARAEREDTNFYLNRVKVFRNEYEYQYTKVIKPKKKKEKDGKIQQALKKQRKKRRSQQQANDQGAKLEEGGKKIWEILKPKNNSKNKKKRKPNKKIKKQKPKAKPKAKKVSSSESSSSSQSDTSQSDLKMED